MTRISLCGNADILSGLLSRINNNIRDIRSAVFLSLTGPAPSKSAVQKLYANSKLYLD